MAQQAGTYLPVVGAPVPIVKKSSCREAAYAIAAIVRDIESFLRRRNFGTLTPAQARRIGALRKGLADQHHNLLATDGAWLAWRGDQTDALFQGMEKRVTDIEEVVAYTMDRVTKFMGERGLLPSDERKAGENVVRRNTVNNPVELEAGLQMTEAAARANAGSGDTAGRRRTPGDDAEELALMTLYPDEVSGIIMRAQACDLTFDETNGRQTLENWSGLNQSQETAVGTPDVSKQGTSHQGKDRVVRIATVRSGGNTWNLINCWPPTGECTSCGFKNLNTVCPAQGKKCHNCGAQGHLARACIADKGQLEHLDKCPGCGARGAKVHEDGVCPAQGREHQIVVPHKRTR
jgi:hypothetical protein